MQRLRSHVMPFGLVCCCNQMPTTNSRSFWNEKPTPKQLEHEIIIFFWFCRTWRGKSLYHSCRPANHEYMEVQTCSVKHMSFCLRWISIGQFEPICIQTALIDVWALCRCSLRHRFVRSDAGEEMNIEQAHAFHAIDIIGQSFRFIVTENSQFVYQLGTEYANSLSSDSLAMLCN